MNKTIRFIALLLVLLMFVPVAIGEETYAIEDIIPDVEDWGLSRTRYKQAYGNSFKDIELEGFKSLYSPAISIEGFVMVAYYEFGMDKGSYNGLSKVIYLLDVTEKKTTAELNKCFDTITEYMSWLAKPATSTKTKAVWYDPDFTLEVSIDSFKEINGLKNKTVAMVFTEPDIVAAQMAATPTPKPTPTPTPKAKTMNVSSSASCNNYNSVGNNWSYTFYINNKKVGANSKLDVSVGDVIVVEAEVIENDKYPDVGTESKRYTVTDKDVKDGFTISLSVDVREDRGRYAGRVATWKISFKFTPTK